MPIQGGVDRIQVSNHTFDTMDQQVMQCAYASHNSLGRLCDEIVYETDVADLLRSETNMFVETQVPLTVEFGDFFKTYRLDLVVGGIIYELKATRSLTSEHEAQALNYAALVGAPRVKLVNFGAARVQGKLLRCPFANMDRRAISVDKCAWTPLSTKCERLEALTVDCIHDWGGFLAPSLITEMLIHFFGGTEQCRTSLPVHRKGRFLGHHRTCLHSDEIGFVVTALGSGARAYGAQLRQLLDVLPLRCWQWINLRNTQLTFTSITS